MSNVYYGFFRTEGSAIDTWVLAVEEAPSPGQDVCE